ncbi:PKD domain-containing protein [Methanogenium cariaci]|uniref:PKD domain-containing protein n=1 Tax=Methanogenium cariaci TaxID=2197 RepID=UPI000B108EBD|nr:PKD domain-containing protein [Methanogenium cariaci]
MAVINTDDDTISTYIPVGCDPLGVATLNDKIFVTNNVHWTNGDPATVSVINTNTNSITASIPVGINPICIEINPITRRAYVSNVNDLSKSVSVINTDTNSVVATIPMDSPPKAVAIVGDYAYVTAGDWQAGLVEIIDTKTNQIISSIQVGKEAVGIAKSDSHIFVANQFSDTLSIINTSTNSVVSVVEVGHFPTYVAFDPLTCRVFVTNPGDKTISVIEQRNNIIEAPVASFTANATAGSLPFSVQFSDTSAGNPTAWNWTFGDGGMSTEQHPVHTYTTAENYAVSLTVKNEGGSDTLNINDYIKVSCLPVATTKVTTFPSSSTLAVGETQEFTIVLENVTEGLSGYNITADLLPWSPDGPSPEPPCLSALTTSTGTDVAKWSGGLPIHPGQKFR